jgi:hypothetical protein
MKFFLVLFGKLNRHPFSRGFDVERAFLGGDDVSGIGDHAVDFGVVVFRVVMKEEEALHLGFQREFDDIIDTAVSPAAVLGIFFAGVLGVHDEDIDAFDEFGDFAVFISGEFHFGGVAAAAKLRIVTMAEVGFVVGKKSDGAAGSGEPIADANAGMIGHAGGDPDRANIEVGFFEFFDFYIGGDFFQSNREKRALHLAGENICEAVAGTFVTKNAKVILLFVNRQKKWEALDMIPMRVSEQQGDFNRGIVELGEELATERAQAGATIENDDLVIGADFDAGGIAAVPNGGWAGSWDGAADAPEFEVRRRFAGGFVSRVLLSFDSSARHDVFQES